MRADTGRSKVAQRALPVEQMIAEATRFEELLGVQDDVPLCIGALSNGGGIDAPSLAQLRADLAGVADGDVAHLSIGVGSPSATQIWLSREPDASSPSGVATRLRVIGDDAAQADAVFAEVSRELDERLRTVEEAERRAAAERARELAEARRDEAEAAAQAKAAERAERDAAKTEERAERDATGTKRAPKPWELWAVGFAAGLAALAALVVLALVIH